MKRFQYVLPGLLFCCAMDACAIELVTEDDPPHNMLGKDGKLIGVAEHATPMPWVRAYQSALSTADVCVFSVRADYPAKLEDVPTEMLGDYLQDVISVWLANNGYHVDTAPDDDYNPQKLRNGRFNFWASSRARAGFRPHRFVSGLQSRRAGRNRQQAQRCLAEKCLLTAHRRRTRCVIRTESAFRIGFCQPMTIKNPAMKLQ